MPRSRYTPQDIDEIRRLYTSKVSATEIARQFKMNHSTVLYYCGRVKGKYPMIGERKMRYIKTFAAKKEPAYKDILKKSLMKKSIRDEKGNIIGWEQVENPPKVADAIHKSIFSF